MSGFASADTRLAQLRYISVQWCGTRTCLGTHVYYGWVSLFRFLVCSSQIDTGMYGSATIVSYYLIILIGFFLFTGTSTAVYLPYYRLTSHYILCAF